MSRSCLRHYEPCNRCCSNERANTDRRPPHDRLLATSPDTRGHARHCSSDAAKPRTDRPKSSQPISPAKADVSEDCRAADCMRLDAMSRPRNFKEKTSPPGRTDSLARPRRLTSRLSPALLRSLRQTRRRRDALVAAYDCQAQGRRAPDARVHCCPVSGTCFGDGLQPSGSPSTPRRRTIPLAVRRQFMRLRRVPKGGWVPENTQLERLVDLYAAPHRSIGRWRDGPGPTTF